MRLYLRIKTIFTPACLSMLAVTASFVAWEFPDFGVLLKGFTHKEALDSTSATMLFCWYAMIFVSFLIGQKIGALAVRPANRPVDPLLSLDSNPIYYAFTIISSAGIFSTLWTIFSNLSLQRAMMF